jgi:2'-5' RNA ligase
MEFAAVAYPSLSEKDFQWIQDIRKKHDKLFYNLIAPHFTLIFPTENVPLNQFIKHVKTISSKFSSFPFVCRCATIGDPDFLDHAHLFMIPDEGFSDIIKLHDAFYTGILESELRLDIPFIPHIGVASDSSPETCKRIADKINQQHFEIRGRIEKLDIIEFDGTSTNTLEQVEL